MRRHKLVGEIFDHGDYIGTNKITLAFLLALMNDRALTKFHQDFLKISKYENNSIR